MNKEQLHDRWNSERITYDTRLDTTKSSSTSWSLSLSLSSSFLPILHSEQKAGRFSSVVQRACCSVRIRVESSPSLFRGCEGVCVCFMCLCGWRKEVL